MDERLKNEFLDYLTSLFLKSNLRKSKWIFDTFLSLVYSKYPKLFHPCQFLTIDRLKEFQRHGFKINSEDFILNDLELSKQAINLSSWEESKKSWDRPLGIDIDYAIASKLIEFYHTPLSMRVYVINWLKLSKAHELLTDKKVIRRLKDNLNWNFVINSALPWSIDFIEEFKEYLFEHLYDPKYSHPVPIFMNLKTGPWEESIIDKYADRLDFSVLSLNKSIVWTEYLLEKFKNRLNWSSLNTNPNIFWTSSLVKKFSDKLDWDQLSRNPSVQWSMELIDEYIDKWNWYSLSSNEHLPWDLDLIKAFVNKWNWYFICENTSIRWSIELIKEFHNKIEWSNISHNRSLLFSEAEIQEYCEFLDFTALSGNESFKVDSNFLHKYEDKIDFSGEEVSIKMGRYYYSAPNYIRNRNLKIEKEDIQYYSQKYCWHTGYVSIPWSELNDEPGEWVFFSRNRNLTNEILNEFVDKWDWEELSKNEDLPWTFELVLQFRSKWDWNLLLENNNFWTKIIEPISELFDIRFLHKTFDELYS